MEMTDTTVTGSGPEISRTSETDPNVVQTTPTVKPETKEFIQMEFNFK